MQYQNVSFFYQFEKLKIYFYVRSYIQSFKLNCLETPKITIYSLKTHSKHQIVFRRFLLLRRKVLFKSWSLKKKRNVMFVACGTIIFYVFIFVVWSGVTRQHQTSKYYLYIYIHICLNLLQGRYQARFWLPLETGPVLVAQFVAKLIPSMTNPLSFLSPTIQHAAACRTGIESYPTD